MQKAHFDFEARARSGGETIPGVGVAWRQLIPPFCPEFESHGVDSFTLFDWSCPGV